MKRRREPRVWPGRRRKAKVVELKIPVPPPDPEVIEAVETLLERVRSGQVQAVGLAYVWANGAVTTGWASAAGTNRADLVFAAATLQHRMLEGE